MLAYQHWSCPECKQSGEHMNLYEDRNRKLYYVYCAAPSDKYAEDIGWECTYMGPEASTRHGAIQVHNDYCMSQE